MTNSKPLAASVSTVNRGCRSRRSALPGGTAYFITSNLSNQPSMYHFDHSPVRPDTCGVEQSKTLLIKDSAFSANHSHPKNNTLKGPEIWDSQYIWQTSNKTTSCHFSLCLRIFFYVYLIWVLDFR